MVILCSAFVGIKVRQLHSQGDLNPLESLTHLYTSQPEINHVTLTGWGEKLR